MTWSLSTQVCRHSHNIQASWAVLVQEESEELRALQSHIAAAETRLGQRLQLQERSAAATAARQHSIALDRALHEQRADVRILAPNHCHWMSCTSTDRALLLSFASVLVRAVVDSDEMCVNAHHCRGQHPPWRLVWHVRRSGRWSGHHGAGIDSNSRITAVSSSQAQGKP